MSVITPVSPPAEPILQVKELAGTKLAFTVTAQQSACILTDTPVEASQLLNQLFLTGTARGTYRTKTGKLHTPAGSVKTTVKHLRKWRQSNLSVWAENTALSRNQKVQQLLTRARQNSTPPLNSSSYEQILSLLQLNSLRSQRFKNLSDFEQARVALGAALVKKKPLLVVANPAMKLPASQAHQLVSSLLRATKQTGTAVFYTTTDPTLASYADQIFLYSEGEFQDVSARTASELVAITTHQQVRRATQLQNEETPEPAWHPRPTATQIETKVASAKTEIKTEPANSTGEERIDLDVLGTMKPWQENASDEEIEPLPGETLEETLQRLAPARNFDPDTAHLLDEAQKILQSLPGAVAPDFQTQADGGKL